jgi:hypothetical protein
MSISILKQPDPLSFSRNQIAVKLSSDVAFDKVNYANALSTIELKASYQVGHTVTINVDGTAYLYTCEPIIENEKTQINSQQPGESLSAYALRLSKKFQKNPDLVDALEITSSGTKIFFWMRGEGSLSITSSYLYNELDNYGIMSPSGKDNARIGLKIFRVIKSTKDLISADAAENGAFGIDNDVKFIEEIMLTDSLELPVYTESEIDITNEKISGSGTIEYDLSNVLKRRKTGHFNLDLSADNLMIIHNSIPDTVRVYAYESYNYPAVKGEGVFLDDFRVVHGGLSRALEANINESGLTISQYIQTNKKFLNNYPSESIIDIYTPVHLYAVVSGDYYFVLLTLSIAYTDGTVIDNSNVFGIEAQEGDIVESLVNVLSIDHPAGLTPSVIKAKITAPYEGDITEELTFNISYKNEPYARYFLFKNELGTYDTIRTTGAVKKLIDITKKSFLQSRPIGFNYSYRKKIDELSDITFSAEINSGILTQSESNRFYKFLASDDVYWLKRGKAYPVNIAETKISPESDGEYNNNHKFIIYSDDLSDELFEEFIFNPEVPVKGDFNLDFNEDFNT